MATNVMSQQESGPAVQPQLERVSSSGWSAGFGNIFGKELGDWFGTRRWLIQAVVWIAIINGMVAFVLFLVPLIERAALEAARAQGEVVPEQQGIDPIAVGIGMFFALAAVAGAIGVIVIGQDEIVGEKQMGTAAWILSKPVSRTAFILAKLAGNFIPVLLFVLAIPAAVAYAEIAVAAGRAPDLGSFLLGLPVVALLLLFYLTLSLMLGVLFNQRGPLLAISLGLLFGGSILVSFVPDMAKVLPLTLDSIAGQLAAGGGLADDGIWSLLSTAVWCVIFMAVAMWRFQRQEV